MIKRIEIEEKMEAKISVNISNHPSSKWSAEQKARYYEIIDVQFPNIDPLWDVYEVHEKVEEFIFYKIIDAVDSYFKKRNIPAYLKNHIEFFIAGEFSFAYALTNHIRSTGNIVVTATTERKSVETVKTDGSVEKTVIFQFVQWREVK